MFTPSGVTVTSTTKEEIQADGKLHRWVEHNVDGSKA